MKCFYRAFREYREKMAESEECCQTVRALSDGARETAFDGQLSRCVWDEAWIDAMLTALPFVEHALEEQRRFIESNAEVRRVDQAKRTTVESVRHLAQHSNLISRIDGEDIVPDKLLIVERDDSYDIYENRFLFTLVTKMQSFLSERYGAVAEINESEGFSLDFNSEAAWNRQRLKASLHLSYERRPARNRSEIDVSEMTAMERVNHLRFRVGQLTNTPLMRQLKGVSPLRPPIVRTNVFKKNENFRRALELYEYLEAYRGPGYEIVVNRPQENAMEAELIDQLCEIVALENFAGKVSASPQLRRELEANFLHENELAEQERIRREEERERQVQARIAAARAEEIEIRRVEVARREAIIEDCERQIDHLNGQIASLKKAADELEQEKFHLQQQVEEALQRNRLLEQDIEHQRQALSAAESEAERACNRLEESKRIHDQECGALREAIQMERNRCKEEVWRVSKKLDQRRSEFEAQVASFQKKNRDLLRHLRDRDVHISKMEKELQRSNEKIQRLQQRGKRLFSIFHRR